jgi:hypothetical protein
MACQRHRLTAGHYAAAQSYSSIKGNDNLPVAAILHPVLMHVCSCFFLFLHPKMMPAGKKEKVIKHDHKDEGCRKVIIKREHERYHVFFFHPVGRAFTRDQRDARLDERKENDERSCQHMVKKEKKKKRVDQMIVETIDHTLSFSSFLIQCWLTLNSIGTKPLKGFHELHSLSNNRYFFFLS